MSKIHPSSGFGKTAAEARAIAADYRTRGLLTLAESWGKTAARLDAQERKSKR